MPHPVTFSSPKRDLRPSPIERNRIMLETTAFERQAPDKKIGR